MINFINVPNNVNNDECYRNKVETTLVFGIPISSRMSFSNLAALVASSEIGLCKTRLAWISAEMKQDNHLYLITIESPSMFK